MSRATVRQAVAELVLEGWLSRRQGIRSGRTVITLERRPAGRRRARRARVDISPGFAFPALPMLLTHRVSWGPDGVPFERVRSLHRGDRLSFTTRLGRSGG